MAPRKAGAQRKAAEKAKMEKVRTVTITLEASEEVLQRLSSLLLFTDPVTKPTYTYKDDDPMPWDDTWPPVAEESVSVDYEVVRRSITKHLGEYHKRFGEESSRAVLNSFGAPRLSLIPESQLLDLNAALEAALTGKTTKEKTE